ncbi:hypothetical protein CHELA40_10322 [Chelatococcus asaccharovorans]|nr:hypothetical protein CHELA40_10322 [Chelatococcus asaccharovorans]CAH1686809.1 hypothetical protein CHELA17_65286 [Chelatococcus asaccharovorans]
MEPSPQRTDLASGVPDPYPEVANRMVVFRAIEEKTAPASAWAAVLYGRHPARRRACAGRSG